MRSRAESAIKAGLFLAAILSVVTTALIVLSLLRETISFFGDVPIQDYLFGDKWTPPLRGDQQSFFGVIPIIWGTLYLTGIGLLVAIPLGLLCAIYLSEYAPQRVRKIVKLILETLAGVPTIVFGYFALTYFTPNVIRALGFDVNQFNALSAGIVNRPALLRTIASVAEDAMLAVPASLREGAFGLGASKLQVSLRIVFPAALSGIVAALILGASRAVGETVIILIAGGQTANLGVDPRESYQSMAAFIAATSRGDIPTGSIEYETIFVVGFTLFLMTLLLNALSIGLVRRYRQVYEYRRPDRGERPRRSRSCPPSGSDRFYGGLFRLFMYFALGLAFLGLGAILYDVITSGASKLSWDFITSQPSRIIPSNSGIQSAL